MSDDGGGGGGGGGDTGGGYSNDYSSNNNDYNNDTSDIHADNDYSGIGSAFSALDSAFDFTSAVESTKSTIDDHFNDVKEDNNDYSGIGSAFTQLENAATLVNNLESIRSAFDDDNDNSSTRLQIDDVSTADKYIPSGGNYIRRNNYLCETSNTTYIPYNNRGFCNNSRWRTENSRNRDDPIGCMAIIISVILLVILVFAMIIGANNNHSTQPYKPIKIEPLPQGVYNTLNMIADKNKSHL